MDRIAEVNEWIRYADNDLGAVNILVAHHPLKARIITGELKGGDAD